MDKLRNWLRRWLGVSELEHELGETDIIVIGHAGQIGETRNMAADLIEALAEVVERQQSTVEYQAKQIATMAGLLGVTFLTPEEVAARDAEFAQETVELTTGTFTRAEVEEQRKASGLSEEEFALQFCTCEHHTELRAQRDLGLPE
jgi:3-methyladenine DNA glycosylase/8-oxoguanine DNA glycosylase